MSRKRTKAKAGNTKFIKQPQSDTHISEADIERLSGIDYPLFSFKYLKETSFTEHGDVQFFRDCLIRLKKLSNLSWKEIHKSDRHKYGTEQIPRKQIRPDLPNEITRDVNLLVFRSNSDKRSMVGFRVWNIFYIIFIEAKHNDIYDHS